MLADGRGVPSPDREGAILWLTRAAEQGMTDAKAPLAELLADV
jgi:TPR repeat protein